MNISKYKLKLYKDNDMIDMVYENGVAGYMLTSKAKKIMSKRYGLKRSYTYRSIRHCGKLQEIYLNIDLERYIWITETEALYILYNKINIGDEYLKKELSYSSISPIDAIIVDCETNVLYAIEIISPSYRESDLNKKENFIQLLNMEAIFIEC